MRRFSRYVENEWTAGDAEPDIVVCMFAKADPDGTFCQGLPAPKRPKRAGCSRVIDARTLWAQNLKFDTGGYDLDNDIPDAEIRLVERRGLKNLTKGEMRTTAPFAWVTWTARIDRLRKAIREPRQFAEALRDCLGLTSYTAGQKLVEVRYPNDTITSMFIAPPTFMEGTPNAAYFSVKKADGWGRTRHLKTGEESFPEAVHKPVEFTDKFKIRYVGRVWHAEIQLDSDVDEGQIETLRRDLDDSPEDDG
jgi:hypothetical protein